jgi:hypothetical protein
MAINVVAEMQKALSSLGRIPRLLFHGSNQVAAYDFHKDGLVHSKNENHNQQTASRCRASVILIFTACIVAYRRVLKVIMMHPLSRSVQSRFQRFVATSR